MHHTMDHIQRISLQLKTTTGKKQKTELTARRSFYEAWTTEAELSVCIISPKGLCGPPAFDLLTLTSTGVCEAERNITEIFKYLQYKAGIEFHTSKPQISHIHWVEPALSVTKQWPSFVQLLSTMCPLMKNSTLLLLQAANGHQTFLQMVRKANTQTENGEKTHVCPVHCTVLQTSLTTLMLSVSERCASLASGVSVLVQAFLTCMCRWLICCSVSESSCQNMNHYHQSR